MRDFICTQITNKIIKTLPLALPIHAKSPKLSLLLWIIHRPQSFL